MLLAYAGAAFAQPGPCELAGRLHPEAGLHLVYSKRDNRLCLLDGAAPRWSAPASHGQAVGKKLSEGDGRTPEGRYLVQPAHADLRHELFMAISYPSPDDTRAALRLGHRPGSSIGIHGPQSWYRFLGRWQAWLDHSDGCIVLDSASMTALAEQVHEPVPIEIVARLRTAD